MAAPKKWIEGTVGVHHVRYVPLTAPIGRRATGKSIHGVNVDGVELRDRVAKSAPHSSRKHVPERFTPSPKIANLDAVIDNGGLQRDL
jgi:hypothetical protein